jgi:hypothetical protein
MAKNTLVVVLVTMVVTLALADKLRSLPLVSQIPTV